MTFLLGAVTEAGSTVFDAQVGAIAMAFQPMHGCAPSRHGPGGFSSRPACAQPSWVLKPPELPRLAGADRRLVEGNGSDVLRTLLDGVAWHLPSRPFRSCHGGHKQAVRARILAAAAEELRRQGLSGIGIPALMKRAGLTHGAFYAHFPNRDALVAEAIRAASDASVDGLLAESLPLEQTLALSLFPEHLALPERGCMIAALGGEGARQPSPVASDGALRLVSSMVGAVRLARLVDDPVLARRLLDAAVPPLDSGPVGCAQARD